MHINTFFGYQVKLWKQRYEWFSCCERITKYM